MAGDDMTALEAWRQMAMAENKRAQRNWLGLDNDKPVTSQEIRRLAQAHQATPEDPPRTKALRQRIQRLHFDGLEPDEITKKLACSEVVVGMYLRGLYLKKPEEPPRTKALRQRIQWLHLDGLVPDEIAAQLACHEAVVWKDLRGLYYEGSNRLSDDYRQMRVARVYAMKQQGLAVSKIAVLLGFSSVLLNKDLREMPQEQACTAVGSENTGRTLNG